MIDHVSRVTGVIKSELHKLTLGKEPIGYAVSLAYGVVPVDDQGQVYMGPLWMVVISMRHPLLTHDDIAHAGPVLGVLPPDSLFRQAAGKLLAECRREYAEALRTEKLSANLPA